MSELDIPKKDWGPGPWQDEPDRLEWRSHGLPCLIVRNTRVTGALCGYVAVPPGHPLWGKTCSGDDYIDFDVHGGITWTNTCSDHICHVPLKGEPDNVWWFGFDCSHAGDLAPRMQATLRFIGFDRPSGLDTRRVMGFDGDEVYRDLEYVKAEVERLAKQLAEVAE